MPDLLGKDRKERGKVAMISNVLKDLKMAIALPQYYATGSIDEAIEKVPTIIPQILKF